MKKRIDFNQELAEELTRLVQANPDLRFGQLLSVFMFNTGDQMINFYEESEVTLNRVKGKSSSCIKS